MRETFDYVIVGAGSAGCVLADRLSGAGKPRAGARGRPWRSRLEDRDAGGAHLQPDERALNWGYRTEPEPHSTAAGSTGRAAGWWAARRRSTPWSTSAAMPARLRPLGATGAAGWSYAEVLPYFRRAETRARAATTLRGGDGPLRVCAGRRDNPLFDAFIEAGAQAGYGATADINGCRQEGFGRMDMTVDRGRRWSAARAYLRAGAAAAQSRRASPAR